MRSAAIVALVGFLGTAPLQCGSGSDPELRRNETPDEALYGLSQKFKKQGDTAAWRATLEYLIERYPSGRFAVRARQELGRDEP